MPNIILTIDTATDACSVALSIGNEILELHQVAPKQHAKIILPLIEKLLSDAGIKLSQVNAISFGCGPAGFTGVRIAASVVQTLAFSADLPVIPISTLQGLAQSAYHQHKAKHVLVCLDARMQEVYWGAYILSKKDIMEAQISDTLSLPSAVELPKDITSWLGIGDGWIEYKDILMQCCSKQLQDVKPHVMSHAKYIAEIAMVYWQEGKVVSAEQALPVYLRGASNWKKIGEQ